ncbi:MAG: stage V sporulation T C-terminal domain-containing protein [Fusicatenibacter sp.]|nr:stage V sporulation T C-terminal domain-containing protein [Lachnospiraceae bacterium]MDY2938927.1 stage V sporulation T C-terminal domain-containing protein [Fusicatenibacter sp.]
MKATGIVRRIDDLGRVVVPKEIRRTMRIREGQAMEIFTGREGEIVLKKYSPIEELTECASQYAKAMAQVVGHLVCISDHEQIVAACGPDQKHYQGKPISEEMEKVIIARTAVSARPGEREYIPILGEDTKKTSQVIVPILSAGDAIGAVMVIAKTPESILGEQEKKLAQVAAAYLGQQMEQ